MNDKIEQQAAKHAIDGAIAYGRMGVNPPPSSEHWLAQYWEIGRQLAILFEPEDCKGTCERTATGDDPVDCRLVCQKYAEAKAKLRAALSTPQPAEPNYAELEAMYSSQCRLTDEWAAMYRRSIDTPSPAQPAEPVAPNIQQLSSACSIYEKHEEEGRPERGMAKAFEYLKVVTMPTAQVGAAPPPAQPADDMAQDAAQLRMAIKCCLDWANGRQSEWGNRAENAFSFLDHVIYGTDLREDVVDFWNAAMSASPEGSKT